MKKLLEDLNACNEAKEWVENKSIDEAVAACHRGDWLLWLAHKIKIDKKNLALAKGHCANTVRHLMKDDRSIAAVDAAIKYGNGEISENELNAAYAAAYAAAAAAAAEKENQKLTADICRQYIGDEIIKKVNEILNTTT